MSSILAEILTWVPAPAGVLLLLGWPMAWLVNWPILLVFVLAAAQSPGLRGVAQVHSIIREGDVRVQLLDVVREVRPDGPFLSWPLRGAGRPRFKSDAFRAYVAELDWETNTCVDVASCTAARERADLSFARGLAGGGR
ncbi:MAG: hypothetical protein JSV81_12895 [Anaerolineales bacterium]|nr:MAG: hypothetical protein JSV81_12895 [Anaerolineales bacterium]